MVSETTVNQVFFSTLTKSFCIEMKELYDLDCSVLDD